VAGNRRRTARAGNRAHRQRQDAHRLPEPAQKSEFLEPLRQAFNLTSDYKGIKLWKT